MELRPDRIGMIGFSAGGHLAVATATQSDERSYEAIDEVDQVSSRPDFAIAAYSGYLKAKETFELAPTLKIKQMRHPCFWFTAATIPSVLQRTASCCTCIAASQDTAELHLYASTTHDFGIRQANRPYAAWTEACLRWLVDQRLLEPTK